MTTTRPHSMPIKRPNSSVYSDCFDFEGHIVFIEKQSHDKETIRALEGKRDNLRREVEKAQLIWNSLQKVLIATATVAKEISLLHEHAARREKGERYKLLANCTAI